MRKLFGSLQAKYMIIILFALGLFQVAYIGGAIAFTSLSNQIDQSDTPEFEEVENSWHAAADRTAADEAGVEQLYKEWSERFPEAGMFWISSDGQLLSSWNVQVELQHQWSQADIVAFMKSRYGKDPYTVVAFVGGDEQNGFVVIELPRELFQSPYMHVYDQFGVWLLGGIFIILVIFIVISYLFFRSIRKRLLHLQHAMSRRNDDGLPEPIHVKRPDEIGQLEHAFNDMVGQLNDGRQRELNEEQIRRELIANLSHDIRTPLTKLRANAYTVSKFTLPDEASAALQTMDSSVRHIDELVDNLLAYTLLSSAQYRYEPKLLQIDRFLREHIAAWYAVFEQHGFEIDMRLSELHSTAWEVDPIWMKRMFDNLLQNVLRHACEGKYVAIETEACQGYDAIRIVDRGQGRDAMTDNKGAGIGLSIVQMMVEGMGLTWQHYRRNDEFIVEIRRQADMKITMNN